MNRLRPRLTYANVVSTLALFLALGGGAVWAADKVTSKQLARGAVKTKNLARGAVKTRNLARGAVKSRSLARRAVRTRSLAPHSVAAAKLARGAVTNVKIADGAVNAAKLAAGTNVIASASGSPTRVDQDEPVDIPLNPPLTVTPVAGQTITVHLEARGTLTRSGAEQCAAFLVPIVNGQPMAPSENLVLLAPDEAAGPLFADGISRTAASFPVGLTTPGQPQSIGLKVLGGGNKCTASSGVEQVVLVATRLK